MNSMNIDNLSTTSISSSSVLFDLSIGVYSAKKTDKEASEKVSRDNNVKKRRAVKVQKDILAENPHLDAITKFAALVRKWSNSRSMPWNDNGQRILPVSIMFEHKAQLSEFEKDYWELVRLFMEDYQAAITAAAFSMAGLFKREDYPSEEVVRAKFSFNYLYSPVPEVGDFRVDIGNIAKNELVEHFQSLSNNRVQEALKDVWGRLHSSIQKIADRLTESNFDGTREDNKKTKLHAVMLTNAEETLDLMTHLNVTKDPELTSIADGLRRVIAGTDITELRKDKDARAETKRKLDDLLSKFDM